MVQQQLFPFPVNADYNPEAFIVGAGVQEAYEMLTQAVPDTPYGFFLYGEPGSGKTHLAHVWQSTVGARFLTVQEIGDTGFDPVAWAETSVVLDEVITLSALAQENLFHLLNALKKTGHKLLMISRQGLGRLSLELPDLSSRLKTLHVLTMKAPDEECVLALISKRFSDFNMRVDPKVPDFLAVRLPRSYEAIQQFVDVCVQEALAHKKKITVPMVSALL